MRKNQANNRLTLKTRKRNIYHVPETQLGSPIFKGNNWVNPSQLPPTQNQQEDNIPLPEGRLVYFSTKY